MLTPPPGQDMTAGSDFQAPLFDRYTFGRVPARSILACVAPLRQRTMHWAMAVGCLDWFPLAQPCGKALTLWGYPHLLRIGGISVQGGLSALHLHALYGLLQLPRTPLQTGETVKRKASAVVGAEPSSCVDERQASIRKSTEDNAYAKAVAQDSHLGARMLSHYTAQVCASYSTPGKTKVCELKWMWLQNSFMAVA